MNNIAIVTDLETSGRYGVSYGDKIIELSAIKVNVDTFEIIDKYHTLVGNHYKLKLKPEITKLTGIAEAMLQNQPGYDVVLKDFYEFAIKDGYPIIGHNIITFDWGKFLKPLLEQYGYYANNEMIDTFRLSKKLIKGLPAKGGYTQKGLADYFGIANKGKLHSAEIDTLICLEIAKNLFRIAESQGEKITFNKNKKMELAQPEIVSIKRWFKTLDSNVTMKRVYLEVMTEEGNEKLFYDIVKKMWSLKSCKLKNIDINYLESKVLEFFKVQNWDEIE